MNAEAAYGLVSQAQACASRSSAESSRAGYRFPAAGLRQFQAGRDCLQGTGTSRNSSEFRSPALRVCQLQRPSPTHRRVHAREQALSREVGMSCGSYRRHCSRMLAPPSWLAVRRLKRSLRGRKVLAAARLAEVHKQGSVPARNACSSMRSIGIPRAPAYLAWL